VKITSPAAASWLPHPADCRLLAVRKLCTSSTHTCVYLTSFSLMAHLHGRAGAHDKAGYFAPLAVWPTSIHRRKSASWPGEHIRGCRLIAAADSRESSPSSVLWTEAYAGSSRPNRPDAEHEHGSTVSQSVSQSAAGGQTALSERRVIYAPPALDIASAPELRAPGDEVDAAAVAARSMPTFRPLENWRNSASLAD
jgi:hypothetical protein